jgi:tRNA threonylcarbamoyl adenosine modification protein YeaZ
MTESPLILAVETSGRLGSVALAIGDELLTAETFSAPMRHSAELFPAICRLLADRERKPEDIEHIYISIGPGSFTGLRIAATFAKIMHLANNNVKIVAVDTLDVIAANVINLTADTTTRDSSHESRAMNHERIAAILDAKRSQFFIAVYQRTSDERRATNHGIWKKTFPDALMTADEFLDNFARKENPIWLLGEGLVYHKDRFKADGVYFLDEVHWYPNASKLHRLGYKLALAGQFADPLTLTPTYLRKPDVTEKRKRRKD